MKFKLNKSRNTRDGRDIVENILNKALAELAPAAPRFILFILSKVEKKSARTRARSLVLESPCVPFPLPVVEDSISSVVRPLLRPCRGDNGVAAPGRREGAAKASSLLSRRSPRWGCSW